jgi:NAD(P)-dependent dehydrogenase (short-subunit alcohol dehydrogenase family)
MRKVLVTGASTGIGRATVRHLKTLDLDVRGGVRKEADAESLREDGIEPVMIDVADADSIVAASEAIGPELYGLVNNAGIAVNAPVEFIPIEDFREQIEVNLIAQVAVTQAFAARIRASKGRIVNVSSVGGKIALPLFGAYAGSKFGLEAVSDSLRRELRPFGVKVAIIEPGQTATPIWERGKATAERMRDAMPADAQEMYRGIADILEAEAGKAGTSGVPPERVAQQIGHALTADRPKLRYPARDARVIITLQKLLGDRAIDWVLARRFKHG